MPDDEVLDEVRLRRGRRRSDNLPLLYQGLLTGIVRVQSRRQQIPDGEIFRKRTKTALHDIQRDALASGYDQQDIRDTHFAVVAFLDSVVLNSAGSIRAEWERKPLQEELFGNTDAGVVFFEKLDGLRSRRNSEDLADILEVYLLCLLLGFEGRYAGGLRAELDVITEKTRRRIEDIRGRSPDHSPAAALPAEAPGPIPVTDKWTAKKLRVIAMVAAGAVLLCFLMLKLNLVWASDQVRAHLMQSL